MLGNPSLVRDDRIKVEKRCSGAFCLDENIARAGRVFNQKRKTAWRKILFFDLYPVVED